MTATAYSHILRYITFRLADSLAGINILDVREIVPETRITRVQQAPEVVMGLANLRGQTLTILDLGIMLGLEPVIPGPHSHIIIFKHQDVGFMVDRIGDVISIGPDQIEPVPANFNTPIRQYTDHVIRKDEDLIMVLDANKLLGHTPGDGQKLEDSI